MSQCWSTKQIVVATKAKRPEGREGTARGVGPRENPNDD